jgi:drug/metabolite transporter (DMT)-like permease
MRPSIKGYLFALLATISFSNVYIFSKAAMQDVSLAQFGLLWFTLALLWNLLYAIRSKSIASIRKFDKSTKLALAGIGVSELIATSAFFTAINLMDNPAMVSFLANASPVFAALLGFLLLNERFHLLETGGIIVTLLGMVIITSHQAGGQFQFQLDSGTLASLIFAFFYAVTTIIAKKRIGQIHPSLISLCRSIFLLIAFGLYFWFSKQTFAYTSHSLWNIGIGSLLGPFLGSVLTYVALKYIEATKTVVVISTRSFFIILGAFLYWGILPKQEQILGGVVTVLGILIITYGEWKKKKRPKKKERP